MSSYYIQFDTLNNIADAIRLKKGIASLMSPAKMIEEIQSIKAKDTDIPPLAYQNSSISYFNSQDNLVLDYAFQSCHSLQSVSLPDASYIGRGAFNDCRLLQSISLPMISCIEDEAFHGCYSLQSINLPNASYIGGNTFYRCYNLLSLYLGSTSVCSLAAYNAFTSTPIAEYTSSTGGVYGSIYVPASLLTSYQTATNWAAFSRRFVGI